MSEREMLMLWWGLSCPAVAAALVLLSLIVRVVVGRTNPPDPLAVVKKYPKVGPRLEGYEWKGRRNPPTMARRKR